MIDELSPEQRAERLAEGIRNARTSGGVGTLLDSEIWGQEGIRHTYRVITEEGSGHFGEGAISVTTFALGSTERIILGVDATNINGVVRYLPLGFDQSGNPEFDILPSTAYGI